MSAIGTKRTYRVALHMSALGGNADIGLICDSDVADVTIPCPTPTRPEPKLCVQITALRPSCVQLTALPFGHHSRG